MKIVRGTRDQNGNVILQGDGHLRKLQCQSCHAYMNQQVRPDGQTVYACACGAQYQSRPIR